MKIKFLGTAAAEGVPALFCHCPTCMESRKLGGKNIRSRSQAIIDDTILIDFNADTYWHSIVHNVDIPSIRNILITHSHEDHLYPADFYNRYDGFYHLPEGDHEINIYAGLSGYRMLNNLIVDDNSSLLGNITPRLIKPYITFDVEGYTVKTFKANHDPKSSPMIYGIFKDGKGLLYDHDSGVWEERVWETMENEHLHFDLVSLDCTGGLLPEEWKDGHLTFRSVLKMVERMKKIGVIDEKTIIVVNHFSHNGLATYDDMSKESAKYGIITSYDGLEIEF